MLKILQARLQQYMNHELPDVQAGFIFVFKVTVFLKILVKKGTHQINTISTDLVKDFLK